MTEPNPIIAVIDETAPEDKRGIYYVVTAALLLDAEQVRAALTEVLPTDRKRPFHWANEGPQARQRMMTVIIDTGVVAHVCVHHPTGRRRQEQARRSAMGGLLPMIVADGAEELIIESRSTREDQRDRQSVIEALRGVETVISYRWDQKTEPLLWVADAVCGVVKEYLLGEDVTGFDQLQAASVLTEMMYRKPEGKTT